jgi:MFS family permease
MTKHDPYGALRDRDFRLFSIGLVFANVGNAMQSVAVGWDLYERTGKALALGGVGLVQVLPVLLLALPAGHLADRFDRRRVMLVTLMVSMLCSFGLAAFSYMGGAMAPSQYACSLYTCLLVNAVARAFHGPANASLWPQLIPSSLYSNAVTWRSGGFQFANVVGPALAGLFIAWQKSATLVYVVDAILSLSFLLMLLPIKPRPSTHVPEPMTLHALTAGVRFVWQTKVILAAVTLDMFAVLLGGATALLPIYAKDILRVGPTGLGWLRAAPAFGALLMAVGQVRVPPPRRAGRALLWAVAGFGVATIVFGLSHSFWLSLAMLALTGALDNISVVVRHSLVQLRTPDAMRGRVSAVNNVFISTSNELGMFESGAVAWLFNPIISVVSGGVGAIAVVLAAALTWPEIRRLGALQQAPFEAGPGVDGIADGRR